MTSPRPHRAALGSRDVLIAAALAALATALLGLLAVDRQSLWLDELGTWRLTVAPNLHDWLAQLLRQVGTNVQLPLYHLYMRAWTDVFPESERWLRWSNLPWLFLAFYALLRSPVPRSARPYAFTIAAVLFVHPLVWYYANEARPYTMLFAAGSLAGSGLLPRMFDDMDETRRARADRYFWIGLALLACMSPMGLVWGLGFVAPAWALGRRNPAAAPRLDAWAVVCGVTATACAAWYVWTTVRGMRVTTPSGAAGIAFGLYEVLGATG